MEEIQRGTGQTKSEKRLARLADKSFLDLWSYPNTFNDRGAQRGQGQELCDLLVVCGDDVLLFSDKEAVWSGPDLQTAWKRWYRKTVEASVKQIRGAERWITQYPDRVFIDPACRKRLPVDFPPPGRMRIHGIAVAGGSENAAKEHFGGSDASLMLAAQSPETRDEERRVGPFVVGDPEPKGSFIHVIDAKSLRLLMRELDTITDFVAYLRERARVFREGTLGIAAGEPDLLAGYLSNFDEKGRCRLPDDTIFSPGLYEAAKNAPGYRARIHANAVSYGWDKLILEFSKNLLAGTSVAIAGMQPTVRGAERALRQMALEDRVSRRGLSEAVRDAFRAAEEFDQDRFARVIPPVEGSHDPDCGYLILILAYRGETFKGKSYADYRELRAAFLKAYCQVALYRVNKMKRIVGLAFDARKTMTGRAGRSEDLMMMEILEWTPELEKETLELSENAEILRDERIRVATLRQRSFDERDQAAGYTGNRKERRAKRARSRRRSGRK